MSEPNQTSEPDLTAAAAFEAELEIFRNEVEAATQFFHAERTFHVMAAKYKEVHEFLNRTPMFWNTCTAALQTSTIITLGRIFDKKSRHNLDVLLSMARNNRKIFSKEALESRIKLLLITPADVVAFMVDAYEPTSADFDRIEALVQARRTIYETNYRDLRHKWFAHRGASRQEIEKLFSATNIEELNQLFQFLGLLYLQLWQLFVNGREPNFDEPFSGMPGDVAVHVTQEAERFLKAASGAGAC
jgi:hypothetical protein